MLEGIKGLSRHKRLPPTHGGRASQTITQARVSAVCGAPHLFHVPLTPSVRGGLLKASGRKGVSRRGSSSPLQGASNKRAGARIPSKAVRPRPETERADPPKRASPITLHGHRHPCLYRGRNLAREGAGLSRGSIRCVAPAALALRWRGRGRGTCRESRRTIRAGSFHRRPWHPSYPAAF
jgi:hypothetical protein